MEEQSPVAGNGVGGVDSQRDPAVTAQLEIDGQPPIEAPAQAVGAGGRPVQGPGRTTTLGTPAAGSAA